MPLLGHQQETEQEILNYFQENHNTSYYLSGEPGVGKTYITSKFIADYLQQRPNHKILIISPANVIKKWINVLSEYNPSEKANRINRKHQEATTNINIVSNRDLSIIDYMDNRIFSLIVYDEIHEVKAGRASYEHLKTLLQKNNYQPNLLGLTGTIFNQDLNSLNELFRLTNEKQYYEYQKSAYFDRRNIAIFINRFWQYVSTTINLANVNADLEKVEIEQKIMPIKLIPLTTEEKLFYDFTKARCQQLSKSGDKLASDLIDFPNTTQFITKHTFKTTINDYRELRANADNKMLLDFNNAFPDNNQEKITRKEQYVSAVSLKELNLTNTQKFNRVKKILTDNPHQTVLVLLNGNDNLKRLAKALIPASDRQIEILKPNTKPTMRAKTINDYLNQKDDNILIANANSIKTGIDLNSVNIIIWYQLLPNLSDILQTQRRAHRLNSDSESKVYYLAYKNTSQEYLINELSQSNTKNASAYGRRSTDALSQLQGIMFDKFQKN